MLVFHKIATIFHQHHFVHQCRKYIAQHPELSLLWLISAGTASFCLIFATYFAIVLNSQSNLMPTGHANSERNSLTIAAESSVNKALIDLARSYASQKNSVVYVNYDQPSKLLDAALDGEPSDLLVFYHPSWIELAKQRGLVDIASLDIFAFDKLILAGSPRQLKMDDISSQLILMIHNTGSIGRYSEYAASIPQLDNLNIEASNLFTRHKQYKKTATNSIQYFSEKQILDRLLDPSSMLEHSFGFAAFSMAKQKGLTIWPLSMLKGSSDVNDITMPYRAMRVIGGNEHDAIAFIDFARSSDGKSILLNNNLMPMTQ